MSFLYKFKIKNNNNFFKLIYFLKNFFFKLNALN